MGSDRGAAAHVRRRGEEYEIDEVTARDGQIGDFLRVYDLAHVGFFRVNTLRAFPHFDLLLCPLNCQRDAQGSNLTNGKCERSSVRTESPGFHRQFVASCGQAGNYHQPRSRGSLGSLGSGFGASNRDARLRNNAAGLIRDRHTQRGQLLSGKMNRDRENQDSQSGASEK